MNEVVPYIPAAICLFFLGRLVVIEKKLNGKIDKAYADRKFQEIPLCNEKHKNLERDVAEIKADVKELLRRNGG